MGRVKDGRPMLRTLTTWLVYNLETLQVDAVEATKKAAEAERKDFEAGRPSGGPWVTVKMIGHYHRPKKAKP